MGESQGPGMGLEKEGKHMSRTAVYSLVIALTLVMFFGGMRFGIDSHPSNRCAEDEDWVTVNYRSSDAYEGAGGVSRACRHFEAL